MAKKNDGAEGKSVAIVQFGSHQYECAPGATLSVELLDKPEGEEFEHKQVHWLRKNEEEPGVVGKPLVDGASVLFQVVRHTRGPKLIIFKKRSKKAWKKKTGFRSERTELKVKDIKF